MYVPSLLSKIVCEQQMSFKFIWCLLMSNSVVSLLLNLSGWSTFWWGQGTEISNCYCVWAHLLLYVQWCLFCGLRCPATALSPWICLILSEVWHANSQCAHAYDLMDCPQHYYPVSSVFCLAQLSLTSQTADVLFTIPRVSPNVFFLSFPPLSRALSLSSLHFLPMQICIWEQI